VKDEGEWAVPLKEIGFDCLARVDQWNGGDHGHHRGQTGKRCEDPLGVCGTEPRDENLKQCAQQKRTRRNQNEVRGYHDWNASCRRVVTM
jgi:hypothetical protein